MAEKRTNQNKSTNRTKSVSSNSGKTSSGRKSVPKRKSPATKKKNGKIYIPLNQVVLFCACIVLICAILLIVTSNLDSKNASEIKKEFAQATEQKVSGVEDAFIKKESRESKSKDKKKTVSETKKTSEVKNTDTKNAKKTDSEKEKNIGISSSGSQKNQSAELYSQKSKSIPATSHPDVKIAETASKTSSEMRNAKESGSNTQNLPVSDKTDEFADFPDAEGNPILVFLFDDGGHNLNQLEKFVSIPFEITVAVLPQLVHSKEAAERVRKSGNELMLHQPMQAVNLNVNPGPGAITPDMTEEEVRSVLFNNLYEIGPVSGVNNHEGSLITADAEKMSYILKVLSDEGLYFLDSRTNVETKVPYVAQSLGYSYYQRNIFLDNTKKRSDILFEIKKGLEYANKNGSVIMIGHVWSADILPEILTELYPVLVQKGYKFRTVSKSGAVINSAF